jgi:hypothetical protein
MFFSSGRDSLLVSFWASPFILHDEFTTIIKTINKKEIKHRSLAGFDWFEIIGFCITLRA